MEDKIYIRKEYLLKCEICGKKHKANQPRKKTCSPVCAKERYEKVVGRTSSLSGIPTGTVGAISEMAIATDMMKRGYSVFRALSQSCFCDLIAYKDSKLLRIECRTGYKNLISDVVGFSKALHGSIDVMAVFVMKTSEIFYYSSDMETIFDIDEI